MPIETITFKNKEYPLFQSKGGAALWVREIAKQYCIGSGFDIGYSKEEWKFPGAIGIDADVTEPFDAMNLPCLQMDFIHSSHCLEHIKENWYNVLDYWLTKIKVNGIIFLYLPHKSQEYWLPENNRKHIHSFDGEEIEKYLISLGHKVIRSGVDLNNSFVLVCEKADYVSVHERLKRCADAIRELNEKEDIKTIVNGGILFGDNKKNWAEIEMDAVMKGEGVSDTVQGLYNTVNSNGDVLMPGCFDKSIRKIHSDFKTTSKEIYCPLDGGVTCLLNLVSENDDLIQRWARLEVVLHGDSFKTGIRVVPEEWNYDFKNAIEPMLPKVFMGISMVRINK